jgi:hypothetical protein
VALLALVALALLLLEDDDFVAALVLEHLGGDGGSGQGGRADLEVSPSPAVSTSLISTVEPASVFG